MATVLEQYRLRQSAWNAQSAAGKLPVDTLLPMLELNYRVDVIDTFQIICKTAPVSNDGKTLAFHYQLVDAYIQLLLRERKFGSRADEAGLFDEITLYIPEDEEEQIIRIVTTVRCDPSRGFISKESPVGKAVLGRRMGDTVRIEVSEDYSYEAVIRSIVKKADDGTAELMRY